MNGRFNAGIKVIQCGEPRENCARNGIETSMTKQKLRGKRVTFDASLRCSAIAADGTWTFEGQLEDISATGARVRLLGKLDDRVRSEEFFLLITPCGKVRRRAKLIWEKKQRLGVRFVGSAAVV